MRAQLLGESTRERKRKMDAPRRLGEKLLELTALLDEPERAQGAEELVSRLLSKLRASERVRQLGADREEE